MTSVPHGAKDYFRDPWLKLERAEKHLREFNSRYNRWKTNHPYEIVHELNPEGTEQVAKIRRRKPFPPQLVCVVSDIIHNLRTALDYLAFALATEIAGCTDPDALSKVYFPHGKDRNAFEQAITQGESPKLRYFTPPISAFFRNEEPYAGGKGEALYAVHVLDRVNKHRSAIDLHSADVVRVRLPRLRRNIEFGPGSPNEVEFARYPLGETRDHDPQAFYRVLIGPVPGTGRRDLAVVGWYLHKVAHVLTDAERQFFPVLAALIGTHSALQLM